MHIDKSRDSYFNNFSFINRLHVAATLHIASAFDYLNKKIQDLVSGCKLLNKNPDCPEVSFRKNECVPENKRVFVFGDIHSEAFYGKMFQKCANQRMPLIFLKLLDITLLNVVSLQFASLHLNVL